MDEEDLINDLDDWKKEDPRKVKFIVEHVGIGMRIWPKKNLNNSAIKRQIHLVKKPYFEFGIPQPGYTFISFFPHILYESDQNL